MKLSQFILALFVSLLFGCSTVKFAEPQPVNVRFLKSFPKSLIGLYVDNDMDTLFVRNNCFKYAGEEKYLVISDLDLELGDAVLKKHKGYYVLSIKSEEEGLWDVVLINQKNSNLHVSYIDLGNNEETLIRRLEKIVSVEKVIQEDFKSTKYIIHPSTLQFKYIIEKKYFF